VHVDAVAGIEGVDMNNERILVLAPHRVDGEFGCGASIAQFIEMVKRFII
jgi:LmbE family N-acetylglucosaminyl deacetylase